MHAAQAWNNVPARYDQARLRRPTTPLTGRGCLIGLEVNLGVTTAVPATEMTSMAEAAPAKVLTTSPTVLRRLLRRFADDSRPSTPEGSLPPFGWGDVATPIRPITGRLSLAPSSFTRCPIGSPCGLLSLDPLGMRGRGDNRLTTFRRCTWVARVASLRRWLAICAAGVRSLRTWPLAFLAQALQQLALVLCDDAGDASPGLTLTTPSWFPTPCCWRSQLRLAPWLPSRRRRLRCPGS
jgi:hypothetical protein